MAKHPWLVSDMQMVTGWGCSTKEKKKAFSEETQNFGCSVLETSVRGSFTGCSAVIQKPPSQIWASKNIQIIYQ